MFSVARGMLSVPSNPGLLPATPRLSSSSSHFLAGSCLKNKLIDEISSLMNDVQCVLYFGHLVVYRTFHEKSCVIQLMTISLIAGEL